MMTPSRPSQERHAAQSPLNHLGKNMGAVGFYGKKQETSYPSPSLPSISPVGDGADAEGQWFGKNMRTDYSKLDTAMAYARSKDLVAEKVNSTGNMKRGTQGPRGRGKGKDKDKNNFSFKKRPDLGGGSQRRSINMVQAGQAKFNQDKENRELEQLVPSNLDWDLLHQTKPQGSDVNSNQAPLEGNIKGKRTPERIGTSLEPPRLLLLPRQESCLTRWASKTTRTHATC